MKVQIGTNFYGVQFWSIYQKLFRHSPYEKPIPFLGLFLTHIFTYTETNVYTKLLIVAQIIVAKFIKKLIIYQLEIQI